MNDNLCITNPTNLNPDGSFSGRLFTIPTKDINPEEERTQWIEWLNEVAQGNRQAFQIHWELFEEWISRVKSHSLNANPNPYVDENIGWICKNINRYLILLHKFKKLEWDLFPFQYLLFVLIVIG